MHHSRDVDVYLNVLSRPVIENCNGIRFAPVPRGFWSNWQGNKEHEAGDMKEGEDMWAQVQDFNWLRAEQSPHWSVLPESHRDGLDWRILREDVGDIGGVKNMIEKLEAQNR